MIRWPQKPVEKPKALQNVDLDPPEIVEDWWVIAKKGMLDPVLIYHGSDLAECRKKQLAAKKYCCHESGELTYDHVEIFGGGKVYPSPSHASRCQCKGDEAKQAICPTGHVGECHFPYQCGQADCSWLKTHEAGDTDPLLALIELLATDRAFRDEWQPGDLGCLCSRCQKAIGKMDNPIVVQDIGGDVYRYHRECLK